MIGPGTCFRLISERLLGVVKNIYSQKESVNKILSIQMSVSNFALDDGLIILKGQCHKIKRKKNKKNTKLQIFCVL